MIGSQDDEEAKAALRRWCEVARRHGPQKVNLPVKVGRRWEMERLSQQALTAREARWQARWNYSYLRTPRWQSGCTPVLLGDGPLPRWEGVDSVAVMGPYGSGTHLLLEYVAENFLVALQPADPSSGSVFANSRDGDIRFPNGVKLWKHSLPVAPFRVPPSTVVLMTIRDPFLWAASLARNPYELVPHGVPLPHEGIILTASGVKPSAAQTRESKSASTADAAAATHPPGEAVLGHRSSSGGDEIDQGCMPDCCQESTLQDAATRNEPQDTAAEEEVLEWVEGEEIESQQSSDDFEVCDEGNQDEAFEAGDDGDGPWELRRKRRQEWLCGPICVEPAAGGWDAASRGFDDVLVSKPVFERGVGEMWSSYARGYRFCHMHGTGASEGRFLVVRYEDLLRRPEEALRALEAIGLPRRPGAAPFRRIERNLRRFHGASHPYKGGAAGARDLLKQNAAAHRLRCLTPRLEANVSSNIADEDLAYLGYASLLRLVD